MKKKILKYNLPFMLITFLLSYSFYIALAVVKIEDIVRCGNSMYHPDFHRNHFMYLMFYEETTMIPACVAVVLLIAVALISLIFYRKTLSRPTWLLYLLAFILPICGGFNSWDSPLWIFHSVRLLLLTAYAVCVIVFTIKDYKKIDII